MNLRGNIYLPSQSLTSGTTYNIFQITAPANQKIVVEGLGIFGAANAAQTPGTASINRASAGGSGGSVVTPGALRDDDTETFQGTYKTLVTSPTISKELREFMVNPQIGLTEYFPGPLAYEIKGGGILVVQFTPQWTGNYNAWLLIGE